MKRPTIAIIGPGKVGMTLGILAHRAGYTVAVGARDPAKAQQAAEGIGAGVRHGGPVQTAPLGELVLLTVSDDAIEPVCAQLASGGAFGRGAVVAHCSGAMAGDVLAAAREQCGAAIGSLHPLQTFPSVEAGLKRFAGTYCFIEGDGPAVAALAELAVALGGRAVRMSSAGKLLYHASAVLACNYFTGLIDAALAMAGHAGIDRQDALAALAPLVKATADNIFAVGPAKALTGPIARGDAGLVERQYRDVRRADPALGDIYRLLGLWTIDVALRKGSIDQDKARQLRQALAGQ